MGLGRTRRRQQQRQRSSLRPEIRAGRASRSRRSSPKDGNSDRLAGRLGPLLAPLCWRSVQVLPQQEFDQEGQLLTNAGFTLQTTTPGDVCGLPAQTFTFTMPAKVRTAARSHRGRCGSAVRRQDVPGHGHRADHSCRQPQLCAGLPRQSSRDPGAAARRGQPLLSRRMPARWRRGAVGDVLTAQLGFDEFLGERVLVTVDLNTAAGPRRGHAAPATRRCTGRRSTPTARASMGQRSSGSLTRHPDPHGWRAEFVPINVRVLHPR